MSRVVVVGAGVAGLTAAYRLASRGHEVVVLEKKETVGGLARSFRHGEFTFDVGPHRFHTYDASARELIDEALAGDALRIGRRSAVWMFGRYFDWPLTIRSVLRLPPPVLLRAARDLVTRRPVEGESFGAHVRSVYGETLYEVFFRPFTERFTGVRCEELAREWGETSIERALIDRGIRAASLASLARSALVPRSPLELLYPASGGIGVFAERLAERIRRLGGEILTGEEVTRVEVAGDTAAGVTSSAGAHPCDLLVWTGAITDLDALLGGPAPALSYLSLLLFLYRVAEPAAIPYQWCYFSDPAVPFSRVSVPSLFNPRLAPAGSHGLCVEIPVARSDARWTDPLALKSSVDDALRAVGLVRRTGSIVAVDVERVPDAYPLYTLRYEERLAEARARLARWRNVRLLGRQASFWYNNMDHSIAAALALAREVG